MLQLIQYNGEKTTGEWLIKRTQYFYIPTVQANTFNILVSFRAIAELYGLGITQRTTPAQATIAKVC